jgi:hypothetical protein
MNDSWKHLPYAPYIKYMIEGVTKITFPKDVKHEPLHLRTRSEVPTDASKHHGSSSSAHVDDPPLHAPSYAHSSSRRRGSESMVKRVLRSIFCMCKTMVPKVNQNRHDIIKMKREMGLPCDSHHELSEFNDPMGEWDAQDAQAAQEEQPTPAARTTSRHTRRTHDDDGEETEEDQPLN